MNATSVKEVSVASDRATQNNIYPLQAVLSITNQLIDKEAISFDAVSSAPKWLRILSRDGYCVYGSTIYVPDIHYALVSSESQQDRNLATAKLLPYIMFLWSKPSLRLSFLDCIRYWFSYKQQSKYFVYEFFYLKGCDHPHTTLISASFINTRKCFGKLVPAEKVEDYLLSLLRPKTPTPRKE